MKILHTADIHLGARMDSVFPNEIAKIRKAELRSAFLRMVDYAAANGAEVVLLAGDIFDSDAPFKKDRDFFYGVVEQNPGINFLYLRGNHDVSSGSERQLPNLHTFSDAWQCYTFGDICIWGAEITSGNALSMYSTLSLREDKTNIVVLHGQVGDRSGEGLINLKKLRGKGIDYLALGHVHKPQIEQLDDRGQYAYCGCLEGRGFDEPGDHGFIMLDVGKKVVPTFVKFAERTINELDVDVSGLTDGYSAYVAVKKAVNFNKKDVYRINLVGETDYAVGDLVYDVQRYLSPEVFFVNVKDKTLKKLDMSGYENDVTITGEFVRCVSADPDYTEEEKKQIISIGLKALGGRDIDL